MARRAVDPPAVVYRNDPDIARATALATRAAIKAAVAETVAVSTYNRIVWTKSHFPTMLSLKVLDGEDGGGLGRLTAKQRKNLLADTSGLTALEEGDGILPSVERAEGTGRFRIAELTALFRSTVLPAQVEASTRGGYYRHWRGVVTWLLAHEVADEGLPMSLATLEALTMEWLIAGASVNTIKNMWSAVEDRHRMFGHQPPLWQPGAFRRRLKALSSIHGCPTKLVFPIGVHHIKAMLRLIGLSPLQQRNVILVAVGTVMCARPCEMPALQVCDVHWGVHAAFHSMFSDGIGLKVKKRKNDVERRGLMTRVPAGLLQRFMLAYVQEQRLMVNPRCTKADKPGARCPYCPPLFPKMILRPGQAPPRRDNGADARLAMSRQNVSTAVKSVMEMLDVDSRHFSGKSMRRGGLSAAITAKVPAPILYLQSGHGKKKAAYAYIVPDDPTLLYMTGKAVLGMSVV